MSGAVAAFAVSGSSLLQSESALARQVKGWGSRFRILGYGGVKDLGLRTRGFGVVTELRDGVEGSGFRG